MSDKTNLRTSSLEILILSECIKLTNLLNNKNLAVSYKDIYSKSIKKQIEATKMFSKLLDARSEILK